MMNFSTDALLRLIGVPASHRAPPSHLKCRVMDETVRLCHSPPPLSLQSISPTPLCPLPEHLESRPAMLLFHLCVPASLPVVDTGHTQLMAVCLAHKRQHHTSCVFVAKPPIKGIITLFTKPLGRMGD